MMWFLILTIAFHATGAEYREEIGPYFTLQECRTVLQTVKIPESRFATIIAACHQVGQAQVGGLVIRGHFHESEAF